MAQHGAGLSLDSALPPQDGCAVGLLAASIQGQEATAFAGMGIQNVAPSGGPKIAFAKKTARVGAHQQAGVRPGRNEVLIEAST